MGVEVFTLTQTLCTVLNSSNINVMLHIWQNYLEPSDTSASGPRSAAPLPLQQCYPATIRVLTPCLPRTRRSGSHWSRKRRKQTQDQNFNFNFKLSIISYCPESMKSEPKHLLCSSSLTAAVILYLSEVSHRPHCTRSTGSQPWGMSPWSQTPANTVHERGEAMKHLRCLVRMCAELGVQVSLTEAVTSAETAPLFTAATAEAMKTRMAPTAEWKNSCSNSMHKKSRDNVPVTRSPAQMASKSINHQNK